jgi:hypothetical protein
VGFDLITVIALYIKIKTIMEIKTISSGMWDWKNISLKAKIEFLKEKFPISDNSNESKCIRDLVNFCETKIS